MKKILFCITMVIVPFFIYCQNVGIGTPLPTENLHVEGTGLFNAPGTATGSVLVTSPSGQPGIIFRSNLPDNFRADISRSQTGLDFSVQNSTGIPALRMRIWHDGLLNLYPRGPNGTLAGGGVKLIGEPGGVDWSMDSYNGFLRLFKPGYEAFVLDGNGVMRLGIGSGATVPAGYRVICRGGVLAERVKVAVYGSGDWSDYVFDDDYDLKPLEEVREFIDNNHHLPNIPSAAEMVKNGNDLGATDALLLAKIEELYLHVIQLNEEIKLLKEKNQK